MTSEAGPRLVSRRLSGTLALSKLEEFKSAVAFAAALAMSSRRMLEACTTAAEFSPIRK
jgi:hypothetical protein